MSVVISEITSLRLTNNAQRDPNPHIKQKKLLNISKLQRVQSIKFTKGFSSGSINSSTTLVFQHVRLDDLRGCDRHTQALACGSTHQALADLAHLRGLDGRERACAAVRRGALKQRQHLGD